MRRSGFAAAAALMAVMTAACQGSPSRTTRTAVSQSGGYSLNVAATPLPLEPKYSVPTLLAGDPTGRGVYFWTDTANGSYIYYVDGSSFHVTNWSLGSSSMARGNPAEGARRVASDGDVWLGIGLSLFRLVPATGLVSRFVIPNGAIIDNTAAESYRPPEFRGVHGIQALAIAPDSSQVVAGLSAASSLAILDIATGAFTSSSLPPSTDAVSLVYTDASHIAVGLSNYVSHLTDELLTGPTSGPYNTMSVPDASVLASDGSSTLVGGAHPCCSVISDQARARPT